MAKKRKPLEHPKYGTLTKLAAQIEAEHIQGELPRMGHIGALAWFLNRLYNQELVPDEREQ